VVLLHCLWLGERLLKPPFEGQPGFGHATQSSEALPCRELVLVVALGMWHQRVVVVVG